MKMLRHIIIWFNLVIATQTYTGKRKICVGALFELSNHWYAEYVNFFVDIIEHVFEEVENRTDILGDYSLQLITKDTEGKNGLAARRMFELMTQGPPVVAVLGPTLSAELTVVGQIAPFYDVVQLSYIASTSSTVDRKLFPTMFKINQIMDDLNPLRIKMMQYFNWNRVGTIFFQHDTSVSEMNMFHDLIKKYNMTLVTSAVVSDNTDIKVLISRMLQYDVRIIMGSFRSTKAPRIFCEAYRQGLYGSNHVWILSGPIVYQNWINGTDVTTMDCTFEQLVKATDGHFTLNYARIDAQDSKTISNLTPTEVTAILEAKRAETEYLMSKNYGWVYDTAWALAVGLNNSLSYLDESGLHNYTNNPYYLDAILKGMHEVDFQGISGPVSFDEAGGRVGVTYIEQNFNDTRTPVAMYNHRTDNLTWFVDIHDLWTGGEIPKDRFIYYRVMVEPNMPSMILIMLGNTACCIVALGFLGFNIYYRKHSNIKLSSPMINNVIIAGSILMFICVFITTFDYGNLLAKNVEKHICMVRVWIMCLGFTSLFGALFSKTWRVHILFRDVKLKKASIKDYHLFGMILFLLMCDCLVLIPWSFTHSLQKKSVVKNKKDLLHHNNIISEVYTFCHHPFEGYWFISMYIYKGLLLTFGTFLAWETRHVTVPALNDSKFIGFCIYNVVIVCIFGVPLMHVLPTEQTTLNYVLLSALVMFCTTMCLCILFIPKIKIRNQVNERFLVPSLNNTATASSCSDTQKFQKDMDRVNIIEISQASKDKETSDVDNPKVEDLKSENIRLRMQIAAETIAITRLKRDIQKATGSINFYKVGSDYVVVQSDKDRLLSEGTPPPKESAA